MPRLSVNERGLPGALAGLGVLILAATAPTQIVWASKIEPPGWLMTTVVAVATLAAGGAAIGAAYYSFHQARQAGVSRRAQFLVPIIQKGMADLRELEGVLGEVAAMNGIASPSVDREWFLKEARKILVDYGHAHREIWATGDMLRPIGEPRVAARLTLVAGQAMIAPTFELDDVGVGNEREVQELWSIGQAEEELNRLIKLAREQLRTLIARLVAPW